MTFQSGGAGGGAGGGVISYITGVNPTQVSATTPLPVIVRDSGGNEVVFVPERALLVYRYTSLATLSGSAAKGSAGYLYGLLLMNVATSVRYVHVYDALSVTGTPKLTAPYPAISSGGSGVGDRVFFDTPIPFTTGILLVTSTDFAFSVGASAGDITGSVLVA